MQNILQEYGPTLPMDQMIVQINQIHHSFEAESYDQRHPEVHEQLPPIWCKMLDFVSSHSSNKTWQILNYGCGTGFEASQVIKHFGEKIECLTCYDPSKEMLGCCQNKISEHCTNPVYFSDWEDVKGQASVPFDLIITNSLLHHLPDPIETFRTLSDMTTSDSFWCMGHEPSKRFYLNQACMKTYSDYRHSRRLKQLLSPAEVLRKVKDVFDLDKHSLAAKTAQQAYTLGLFQKCPPKSLMGRIVDYHVAHSLNEAESGRGFCFQEMETAFVGAWKLGWRTSYSYMGPFYEGALPRKWKTQCELNAGAFSDDGANFAVVWQKGKR